MSIAKTAQFGDTWRTKPGGLGLDFWDGMWAQRRGTPLVEGLLAEAAKHNSIIEIGCGAGHFLEDLATTTDWTTRRHRYQGYEISEVAAAEALRRHSETGARGAIRIRDWMAGKRVPAKKVDLVLAIAVLIHQPDPAAFITRALQSANKVVAFGVGYIHGDPKTESTFVDHGGHADWRFGVDHLVSMSKEAGATKVEATVVPNPLRPGINGFELLLILRK